MNRRLVLKQMMLATAAAALIPSCTFDGKKITTTLKHLTLNGDNESLLAQICEAIIPSDKDVPGAQTLNLPVFVLKMVDDCFDSKAQSDFQTGLSQWPALAKTLLGKSFAEAAQTDKESFLRKLEAGDSSISKEVTGTYSVIKQLTVQGFLTSQYVMEAGGYEFVPARFHGCVDVPKKKAAA